MADAQTSKTEFTQIVSTPIDGMQIISANDELFNHVDADLPMWAGDGDRMVRSAVTFSKPFVTAPHVMIGNSGIDSSQGQNLRFNLMADNITKDGFDVVFRTWGDTRIARASVCWSAAGQSAKTETAPAKDVKAVPQNAKAEPQNAKTEPPRKMALPVHTAKPSGGTSKPGFIAPKPTTIKK